MSREEKLERFGRWVKETCDLYGCEPHTGYLVAGLFVQGLTDAWRKADRKEADRDA